MRGFLVCALAVMAAAPAAAQIVPLNVQGPYVQAASGMTFPEAVDDFRRVSVLQYKPDGSDISAGYQRTQPHAEIVATAYSFPTPPPPEDASLTPEQAQGKMCDAVASQIVHEVEAANPAAERLHTNLVALSQMGGVQHGRHALYAMTVPVFLGRQQEAVKSEAYVFCYAGGKWTVEYRFTYPAATPDAGLEIANFMADLKWAFAPR